MAIKTSGINYRPPSHATAHPLTGIPEDSQPAGEESISTLHLEMRLKVDIGGDIVELNSPLANCGSECRQIDGAVDILRLAKDGRAAIPGGGVHSLLRRAGGLFRALGIDQPSMQWLVTMEEGALMVGAVDHHALMAGEPTELTLHGRMLIQYQVSPWGDVARLLSRSEPFFKGNVTQWPPRGSSLSLSNGPIEYYAEDDVDRPNASPVLRILSNDVTFGDEEVSLLKIRPEITNALRITPAGQPWTAESPLGGVSLSWTDTRKLVSASDPPVRYYHLYRKFEGDDVNGWVLIRRLPADVTTWTDTAFTGRVAAEYVVLHAAAYPFGYRYESSVGRSVTVAACETAKPK